MKLVFAGSPAAAVPTLHALAASEHEVALVITREDSPLGRKRVLTPTPVGQAAEELGLPVLKTDRLRAEAEQAVVDRGFDLGVIVAYGGLVREPLLSAPRLGWINLHFSLLPRWRGAAPVQRAVIAGDDVTGASVFQLVPELDAGEVYGTLTQAIGGRQTSGHLLDTLAVAGAPLVTGVVDALAAGTARGVEQVGDVTLAPKLGLDDARLDWSEPAGALDSRIRGVTPEPGAFTLLNGERFKIHEAHLARDAGALPPGRFAFRAGRVLVGTGSDPLELVRVQPAGKKAMAAADWWRGSGAEGMVAE